jgi:hypothetical protein
MSQRPLLRYNIVAHARPESFVEHTLGILSRLGYQIMTPEEFEAQTVEDELAGLGPDLRIVDERRLGEVEDEPGEEPAPIILLTGRHGVTGADARIAGAVRRPAGLHDLYRLLQLVFEEKPRATPRVPTHLPAVCRRDGRQWKASILSISENGCLLRSPEPLPLGSHLDLNFELPSIGPIGLRADTAYQYVPDLGLVFSSVPADSRLAIGSFVNECLRT